MKRQLLAMAAATTAIPTIAAATTLETFTLTMEVISATGPARDPDGLNPDPFCRDDEVAVGTTETISGVSFSFVPTEAGATSGTGSLTESGETLSGPSTFLRGTSINDRPFELDYSHSDTFSETFPGFTSSAVETISARYRSDAIPTFTGTAVDERSVTNTETGQTANCTITMRLSGGVAPNAPSTPTPTVTPTPVVVIGGSPTPSPSPSTTPIPSPSVTVTPTAPPPVSPSPSTPVTPSATPPQVSPSPSVTATPSGSPTASPTPGPSATPSASPSPTPSATPTPAPEVCEEPATTGEEGNESMLQEPGQRLDFELCDGEPVTLTLNQGTFTQARAVEQDDLPLLPADASPDFGFYAFVIDDLDEGASATVTLTLPQGSMPDAYVKCMDDACSYFEGATFSGDVVTLTLVDGGAGDADGVANGVIVDPGAPVTRVEPDLPLPDGNVGNSSGGGAMVSLLGLFIPLSAAGIWLRRRRR